MALQNRQMPGTSDKSWTDTMKTTYKESKNKTDSYLKKVYSDSSYFSHSECGSPTVKTYPNKRTFLEEK